MTVSERSARRGWALIALPVIIGLIVIVETHHRIPAFRAWTFGLIFLLFATATALSRGAWRNASLVVTTIFFSLLVLEVTATVLEPKTDFQTTPNSLVPNLIVGWVPGFVGVHHARKRDARTGNVVFDVDYTIDKHLDRQVKGSETGPAVVFFGDSFTFGVGLPDTETLPQQFSDLFDGRQRVVNLGISGYAPQQFLRRVQTGMNDQVIGAAPAAFVYLTSPFHAKRTACKENWVHEAPRYSLVDGKVVLTGRCYEGASLIVDEFLENTALYRYAIRPFAVRLTHADVDLYMRILVDAVRLSKSKYGVETLVPFVRSGPGYLKGTGYDDDSVFQALKAQGVHVVDMTLPDDPSKGLYYSIRGDGHPTGLANHVRARMIADALENLGVPLNAPPAKLSAKPGAANVVPQ